MEDKKKRNNILVPCVCTEKTQTETDANRRMLPGLAPCKPEFTQSDPTLTHDHWLGICCDPPGSQGFSSSGRQGQFRRGHVVFFHPTVRSKQVFLLFLTRVHFLFRFRPAFQQEKAWPRSPNVGTGKAFSSGATKTGQFRWTLEKARAVQSGLVAGSSQTNIFLFLHFLFHKLKEKKYEEK